MMFIPRLLISIYTIVTDIFFPVVVIPAIGGVIFYKTMKWLDKNRKNWYY